MEIDAKVNHRKERLREMLVSQIVDLGKSLSMPNRYYTPEQKAMLADIEAELRVRQKGLK
jgi:hypothetical protein